MKPHKYIGNYLHRWHLIPRNRFFNIYLHKWVDSDNDRACHDHPWASVAVLLNKAHLYEIHQLTVWKSGKRIKRFVPMFRPPEYAHKMLLSGKPAWTLFITGPKVREWGFHCPKGWQHWSTMTTADGKNIGGCE